MGRVIKYERSARRTPARNHLLDIVNHADPHPKLYQKEIRISAAKTHQLDSERHRLEGMMLSMPFILFRAYSKIGGRTGPTKGYIDSDMFRPPTDVHTDKHCHDSCFDMAEDQAAVMIGNHLCWKDRNDDEFISWTTSILFAIEHALGRSRKGEKGCYISMIDTSAVRTATTETADERPTEFFLAHALLKAYNVLQWPGWGHRDDTGLHPRKFTHEYLSHGVVLNKSTPKYRHVDLKEIIKAGLFKVYPEFKIPHCQSPDAFQYESTGLYDRLSALRQALFPRRSALRPEHRGKDDLPWEDDIYMQPAKIWIKAVKFAYQAAQLFLVPARKLHGMNLVKPIPPIHLFLYLLALRRRPKRNSYLRKVIQKYWTATDIQDHVHPGMEEVFNNLPENMQYQTLVREALGVFNLPPIPSMRVIIGDGDRTKDFFRAEDDALNPEVDPNRSPQLYRVRSLKRGTCLRPDGNVSKTGTRKRPTKANE